MSALAVRPPQTPEVNRGETVRGSFVRVSMGFAVYAACQWAIVAVIAKLGSPELVGRYAFAVALTTPVLMLAQMNLRLVLATDTKESYDFCDYRNLRFELLLAAMLAIALLAVREGQDRLGVILLVGAIQAGEWAADVFYGRMQQRERTSRMAWSLTARGVLGIVALAVSLKLSGNLITALIWMLCARTLVYFAYDSTYALRGIHPQITRRDWRQHAAAQWRILKEASPLGVVLMLGALVANTPRYFIAGTLGDGPLGVFSAIFSLATAGNLVVNSLGQAAIPRLARSYAAGDVRGFRLLSLQIVGVGAGLALAGLIGAATLGSFVLTLVYRPEYARQGALLVVAMAAAGSGFIASLLGYSITAARRFSQQMPLLMLCLAATALSAYWLVPRFALTGAAVAVGVGSAVQVLAEAWMLRSVLASMQEANR